MKNFKNFVIVLLLLGLTYSLYKIVNEYDLINHQVVDEKNKGDDHIKIDGYESRVTLTLVGDLLYEQPYYDALEAGESEELLFNRVKKYFQNDLSLGNMEVVIGNDHLTPSGSGYNFCAPESIGKQVVSLGMDVLSTANNHANDRGLDGRISTIDFFKNNSNILTVGTYKPGEKDIQKNVKVINGIKFGFLAYTYGTNIKVEENFREEIGLFRDPDNKNHNMYEEKIKKEVASLRPNVDVLVVFMHWGKEFTYTPDASQKTLANMLNSLGVDLIVGTHSHSIQPIERIVSDTHETLTYYSLGNFVSADDDISRTGETFDNAYQFGLLSKVDIVKNDNGIYLENIESEPIVNYYDSNMRNFELIPLSEYDEKKETTHYRYKMNFNRDFIESTFESVISEEFRTPLSGS